MAYWGIASRMLAIVEITVCMLALKRIYRNMPKILWEPNVDTVAEMISMATLLWEGAIYAIYAILFGVPIRRFVKFCKSWQVVYIILLGALNFPGLMLWFSSFLGVSYVVKLVNGKFAIRALTAVTFVGLNVLMLYQYLKYTFKFNSKII